MLTARTARARGPQGQRDGEDKAQPTRSKNDSRRRRRGKSAKTTRRPLVPGRVGGGGPRRADSFRNELRMSPVGGATSGSALRQTRDPEFGRQNSLRPGDALAIRMHADGIGPGKGPEPEVDRRAAVGTNPPETSEVVTSTAGVEDVRAVRVPGVQADPVRPRRLHADDRTLPRSLRLDGRPQGVFRPCKSHESERVAVRRHREAPWPRRRVHRHDDLVTTRRQIARDVAAPRVGVQERTAIRRELGVRRSVSPSCSRRSRSMEDST